ncbi:MAG: zinc-ribbon domain-containing protein [Nitrosarchaeum sp.]
MKPQSCRNCGKELWQNQKTCTHCGRESEREDTE